MIPRPGVEWSCRSLRKLVSRIDRVIADLRPHAPSRPPQKSVRTLGDRMRELGTPGVSIAVIENSEVAWARGFGIRKVGEPAKGGPDTPFQAGSISKPLFALAVMRAVPGQTALAASPASPVDCPRTRAVDEGNTTPHAFVFGGSESRAGRPSAHLQARDSLCMPKRLSSPQAVRTRITMTPLGSR